MSKKTNPHIPAPTAEKEQPKDVPPASAGRLFCFEFFEENAQKVPEKFVIKVEADTEDEAWTLCGMERAKRSKPNQYTGNFWIENKN